MALIFEWDPQKAATNLRKHAVAFPEAITIFGDPFELLIADPDHSIEEERLISIGTSERGRILLAVYTEIEMDDDQVIRLISAREAESIEAEVYLQRRRG